MTNVQYSINQYKHQLLAVSPAKPVDARLAKSNISAWVAVARVYYTPGALVCLYVPNRKRRKVMQRGGKTRPQDYCTGTYANQLGAGLLAFDINDTA